MMKKYIALFSILVSYLANTQNFSTLWKGHYSYLNIKDVVQGDGKVFAAAENAVFIYDTSTFEIETVSTVEGTSGEFITTLHYSEIYNLLIIGYKNGLIEVYDEDTESVTTVIDIVDKPTIPPDNKRINHFNEHNGLLYIATDYGISVYDLENLEFGDTYFIGEGGTQIIVTQTTVLGDFIYASCLNGNGLKRALIENDDLINYEEWLLISQGDYIAVESVQDKIYTVSFNKKIFEIIGTNLFERFTYPKQPVDVKESEEKLIVALEDVIYIYDSGFNIVNQILDSPDFDAEFTSAITALDDIYIGSEGFGILKTTTSNPSTFEDIHPDGPLRNNAFSIRADFGSLWVSYGDYTLTYNPAPARRYGVSHLVEDSWVNILYDSIKTKVGRDVINLNTISINPNNPQQVFISSFHHGILEVTNDQPVVLFNESNSGLESLVIPNNPNVKSIRVSGSNFDQNGILWSMTARVDRPLKSYNPETGQWQGFDFTEIIPNGLTDELGFSDVIIGSDGTKWIGGLNSGVIGFNENENQIKNIFDEFQANLPTTAIQALALDNRNQLWIGTQRGLRVLYNTANFFTSNTVTTNAIIILEDGIPRELLEQQFISDIKVDGSNNKWIATIGSGAFYFSSDGQETIYHFTKDNSPLPSNNITEISIDDNSGTVFIATDRGLLSFKSGGSSPNDNLADAFVFPNPVRPNFDIVEKKVKIKDISQNCNIKITDIEGNLVAEAESNKNLRFKGYNLEIDGGTAFWNGKNLSNNVVSSGVYLVMISDLDTLETKVLKLMVVR